MRLIDAEELQRVFNEVSTSILREPKMTKDMEHIVRACIMTTEIIKDAPTIEANPVKHGHWIDDHDFARCSLCNRIIYDAYYEHRDKNDASFHNYCPYCGAKMDGGTENAE